MSRRPRSQSSPKLTIFPTRRLTINTRLTRFPGGAPFFNAMPSLHELTLTSAGQEPFPKNRLYVDRRYCARARTDLFCSPITAPTSSPPTPPSRIRK